MAWAPPPGGAEEWAGCAADQQFRRVLGLPEYKRDAPATRVRQNTAENFEWGAPPGAPPAAGVPLSVPPVRILVRASMMGGGSEVRLEVANTEYELERMFFFCFVTTSRHVCLNRCMHKRKE